MGKLVATTQATLDGVVDPVGESELPPEPRLAGNRQRRPGACGRFRRRHEADRRKR